MLQCYARAGIVDTALNMCNGFDGMKEPVPPTGEAARHERIFGEASEIVRAARKSAARLTNAGGDGGVLVDVERLAAALSPAAAGAFSLRNAWLMRALHLPPPGALPL